RHACQRSAISEPGRIAAQRFALHDIHDGRQYRAGVGIAPYHKRGRRGPFRANTTEAMGTNDVWRLTRVRLAHRRLQKTAESQVEPQRQPPAEFANGACDDKDGNSSASKWQKKPAGDLAQGAEGFLHVDP